MSVELRPLGVACNIQCQYCYQNPPRDAGNVPRSYDVEAMKAAANLPHTDTAHVDTPAIKIPGFPNIHIDGFTTHTDGFIGHGDASHADAGHNDHGHGDVSHIDTN